MATTSARTTTITFTGDVASTLVYTAAPNQTSPAYIQFIPSLVSGGNTITVPTAVGFVPTAMLFAPPAGNIVTITLKGVGTDTGIPLHLTDYTNIAIASSMVNFVLTVGAAGIIGLRIIWS